MPRKAAYELLDDPDDGDALFEFVLAEKLHMTVAQLGEMDNAEYVRWYVYLGMKAQRLELAQKAR